MRTRQFLGAFGALLTTLFAPVASASNCVAPAVDWSAFPSGFQCIVGVQQFTMAAWNIPFPHTGGAPEGQGCAALGACLEWVDDLPDKSVWNRYDWGTKDPQAYDVLIFPPTSGNAYGHAAMFDHVSNGTVFVMDDNWDGNMNRSCSWAGHDGWVHDGIWTPYGFYRLKSMEPAPADLPPKGTLDQAGCDAITGWAQDPDDATKSIGVDVYFDGMAGSGAPGVSLTANVNRADLCGPLGSCEHGFSMAPPIGLRDAKDHPVFPYGIDTKQGGPNSLLDGSPKSFNCQPPKAPAPAIKRHIVDPPSLDAWKLSMLNDVARFDAASSSAITTGPDAPAAPKLEQADDGSPEVWVVEGKTRRHVLDGASMTSWHFDAAAVVKTPAAQVNALTKGQDWPESLFAFVSPDGAVYILDVPPPPPAGTGGSGGSGGSATTGAGGHAGAATAGMHGTGGSPGSTVGAGGMHASAGTTATSTGGAASAGAPAAGDAVVLSTDGTSTGEGSACAIDPGGSKSKLALTALLALAIALVRRRRR